MALDGGTAACAALNLAYFSHRLASGWEEDAARRAALLALILVSLGALVESVALLAMAAPPGTPLASASWAVARALPFAGTASISILVTRRLASG
jgi:hypothetical protein